MPSKKTPNDLYELFHDCPTFLSLNPKHQLFVLEYVKTGKVGNSALRANIGGNAPAQCGSRLLTSAKIKKAKGEISHKFMKEAIADAQEVRIFWTNILRGKITDLVDWNKDGLLFVADSKDIKPEVAKLIKKVKVTTRASAKGDWTESETNLELHDPLKASELLAKDLGMLTDKVELSGKDGEPIRFTETERAAKLQHLLALAAERKKKNIKGSKQ